MTKEIDIEIYKHISDEMEVAEIYLGHILFAFHYTKATYTATCTEAFPFNPFDKVICELLKVEQQLSFENIGDILGMNVSESENPKRYLDLAEKEILTEALQSLASNDFRMIEGGDINFSRCKLTTIGREYAEKKNKYRVTANKPFTIYFDHTTGNHIQAKKFFEFVDGRPSTKRFSIEFADETALKEIAAIQIPDIYNPEKQYSFTDAVLKKQSDLFVEYPVAITFNTKDNSYRFYCYDYANKSIHEHFNHSINSNEETKQKLLSEFSAEQTETTSAIDFIATYSNQIAEYVAEAKVNTAKSSLIKLEFVDEQLFLSAFNELFSPTEKVEMFLCLPIVTPSIYKSISSIVQDSANEESRFYFVFPNSLSESINKSFNQLKGIANEVVNLYVMQQNVKSFLLFCKTETEPFYFEMVNGSVNEFEKIIFQRKNWDKRADKVEQHFIEKFSDVYALNLCNIANTVINDDMQETVSKEQLDELAFYEFKLEPFDGIGKQGETVGLTLDLIENFREERIAQLEEKLTEQLDGIEAALENVTDEKDLGEIEKALTATTVEIIFNDSEAFKRSESFKTIIGTKKEVFAEARKIYSFIFDTNIYLNHSDTLQKVKEKDKIIVPLKVLDELDGFKANPEHKAAASSVIREIHANKKKNIHKMKANIRLLPIDFNKHAPDNIILSTALAYKKINGILITDDKGFQEKARTVELRVMSYEDFISTFVNSKK